MFNSDYTSVTEIAGDKVTKEQIQRLCNRYYWAGGYCSGKDVLEVACGTGQGLGYLSKIARNFEAGDCSKKVLTFAYKHYVDRIPLLLFDAQNIPFADKSKDVIILFEAIYYIPNVEKFIKECVRVLRPGGIVLIATANKDLYDFNPSLFSYKYYGVVELRDLFARFNFKTEFFGDSPASRESLFQKMLMHIKKIAVIFNLIPKTMEGKKILKRVIFGRLAKLPAEITESTLMYLQPNNIFIIEPDTVHKIIFCAATLNKVY